ncbi:hypothetical protein JXA32_06370 [Candidatus Sumerlaeota bacterium]|nr:hypothetical protein [Candidatus Sumerlaeota bacterium]
MGANNLGLRLTQAALGALFAAILLPGAAWAEINAEEYRVGFNGKYHSGVWTPVYVTLSNRPAAGETAEDLDVFFGYLTVETSSATGRKYIFRQDVEVGNSRKRYILYARFSDKALDGGYRPELNLYQTRKLGDKTGRRIFNTTLDDLPLNDPRNPLCVIASTQQGSLRAPMRSGVRGQATTYVPPETLPDRWYGYQGVSLLVIPRIERNGLDAQQEQALLQWVESGGHALILGGKDAELYAGSFVERELGVSFLAPRQTEIPIAPFEEYGAERKQIMAEVSPITGQSGKVLLKNGPLTLARRIHRGKGFVDVWAFGLDDANLERTPLVRMLWDAPLSEHTIPSLINNFGVEIGRNIVVGSYNPPSIILILAILGLYFLVVGPINFLYLAKIKKLELAWFTLPVIILGFSLGTYGLGVLTKGDKRTLDHYHLVECKIGEQTALVNSQSMIWSTSKSRYSIAPKADTAAVVAQDRWLERSGGIMGLLLKRLAASGGNRAGETVELAQDDRNIKIASQVLEQWALEQVAAQDLLDLDGGFQGEIAWDYDPASETNRLEGRLINNTPYNFQDVYLMMPERTRAKTTILKAARIDSWRQGDELLLDPAQYTSRLLPPAQFAGQLRNSLMASEGGALSKDVAINLIQSRFDSFDAERGDDEDFRFDKAIFRRQGNMPFLLCRTTDLIDLVKIDPAEQSPQQSNALFVVDLAPSRTGDSFQFEEGMLRPMISDEGTAVVPPGFGNSDSFQLTNASLLLAMRMPEACAPMRPRDLDIRATFNRWQPNSSKMSDEELNSSLLVEVYNFSTGKFEPFYNNNMVGQLAQFSKERRRMEEVQRRIYAINSPQFVNPFSGEMLFRVSSQINQEMLSFGMEGSSFYDLEVSMQIQPETINISSEALP